ncbi:MAG: FG-GAP-like repeat-containing protein, partial [Planctomycetota bacterium]
PDEEDIAGGASSDCNRNGVPDECERDCNGNGVADDCETDCNCNGLDDGVEIATGLAEDCDGDGVPDECDRLVMAGAPVHGLVVGDLEGDGDADVVGRSEADLVVFENVGDGRLWAHPAQTFQPFHDMAIGDLDEDGDADAALFGGAPGTDGLQVLSNVGDGTFQLAFADTEILFDDLSHILIGDVDGDDHLDLVLVTVIVDSPACGVCSAQEIDTRLGDGAGGFTSASTGVAGPYEGAWFHWSAALADVDGDGLPDLVTTALDSSGTPRLTVRRSTGNGRFQVLQDHEFDDGPGAICVGDIDGDGDEDVCVAGSTVAFGTTGFRVFINDGGVLAAPIEYALGTTMDQAALGDRDGDGDLDAIALDWTSGQLLLLENQGGVFADPVAAPLDGPSSYTGLGVADLDGDGRADAVLGRADDASGGGLELHFADPGGPADLDGDGLVDIDDLLVVIMAWGPCPGGPAPCPADLDRNGVVDVDDLLEVVLAWSRCG